MTQTVTDLISQHAVAALAIIFFVSLGEALFIVGLFVPSTVVLIAAGGLIGGGKLPFLPVLIFASAGAIAGDALSFWVGHHYKGRLRSLWPFNRYTSLLDKGEAFFDRHGGKSIFIGRFVPGVKAIVPGIAVMAGMNFAKFSVVNIVSAVVWAAAHLVPAAGIGLGLSRVRTFDPRLAVLAVTVIAAVLIAYYLAKIAYGFAYPVFDQWRIARVATRSSAEGWLASFETRFLTNDRGIVGWTLVLFVAALAASGFVTLLADLLYNPELKLLDKSVYNVLQSLRSEAGTRVMTALTMGADGFVLIALTIGLIAVLLIRKRFALAGMTALAIGVQSLFVPVIKGIIERPRPTTLYSGAESFSFPSGHATQSMTVFGILAVIVAANLSGRWRPIVIIVAMATAAFVAFSRLYLGAHWLSDVSAGFCLGLLITALFAFFTKRLDKAVGLIPIAAVLLPVYAVAYIYHLNRDYDHWISSYAPVVSVQNIARQDWLKIGWQNLAHDRLAMDGDRGEALVFQTDLSVQNLTAKMSRSGWRSAPAGTLVEALLPSTHSLTDRPTAPLLHEGTKPVIAYTLPSENPCERLVLRFWTSAYAIGLGASSKPILLGGVSQEILKPFLAGYATLDVVEPSQRLSFMSHGVLNSILPDAASPIGENAIVLLPSIGGPRIVRSTLLGPTP